LKYFQRAADANNPIAMAFLGKMYLEGNDAVEADNATALRWFQQAAEQSSPVGQSGLGLMYLTGRGLPKDFKKAMQYFTLAADQGWVDGQLHLGNMYMSGIGVRRDYQLAAKYYNLAAQSGHILAIYNLAQMHATGTGMMRSCTAAVEFYKSVAERGRWGLLLSEAHFDHQEKRYSAALIKYLILSELGYEVAQSNAAFLFERGEIGQEVYEALYKGGVFVNAGPEAREENPEAQAPTQPMETLETTGLENSQVILSRALQYWSRAATQGYTHARVRLGDYYYYGWGTPVDYSSAAAQYRQASEVQRNPQAMFNLAYMHEQGLGLKQDLHLAKRFYDMAAETSVDAGVPVALALMKLSVMTTFHSLFSPGGSVVSGGESAGPSMTSQQGPAAAAAAADDILSILQPIFAFGPNWDLYLLTFLVGILGFMIYFRRPHP
jgi:TPR repeat protein